MIPSIKQFISENGEETPETKIFNDPIHGHIELHSLLVKVIDTPQFQRLRNIKQLGGNYFVFPGASHNRFEHCIGTCYLAGKLARHLKEIHPGKLDDRDILCVELAGLCHDLGHGPFSHMFDMKFLPKANPGTKWTHEKGSCDMLDHLIKANNLESEFKNHKLESTDITFIKELINGPCNGAQKNSSENSQIVSNGRNKVDVDKWDYFARDCYHLGIKNSFDHNRFMKFLKVLTVNGENPQICARDKEVFDLYDMFHVRANLHRDAYQHKCKIAVESMICDAMLLADKHILIPGENGNVRMSEAVDDPVAFTNLSDHVYYQILYSTDPSDDMVEAREILRRIQRRDLYKFVGGCKSEKGKDFDNTALEIQKELASFDDSISPSDLVVTIKKFNYGMQDKNPCDLFRFYSKQNPDVPYQIRKEEVSHMLPDTFQDCEMLVHCKDKDNEEAILSCLVNWCTKNGYKPPNTLDSLDNALTPMKDTNKRCSNGSDKYPSAKKMHF